MVKHENRLQLIRILLICGGLFSVGTRIIVSAIEGPTPFHTFRFYTIQTNTMILVWTVLSMLWENSNRSELLTGKLKGALTTYITITMVVFIVLIEPTYNPPVLGLDWWTSLFNHYLNPMLFILDFILSEEVKYEIIWSLYWLIYPLLYLFFTQIWGLLYDFYPYFFVNPKIVGVNGLIVWTVVLSTIFFLFGYGYVLLNNNYIRPWNNID